MSLCICIVNYADAAPCLYRQSHINYVCGGELELVNSKGGEVSFLNFVNIQPLDSVAFFVYLSSLMVLDSGLHGVVVELCIYVFGHPSSVRFRTEGAR